MRAMKAKPLVEEAPSATIITKVGGLFARTLFDPYLVAAVPG